MNINTEGENHDKQIRFPPQNNNLAINKKTRTQSTNFGESYRLLIPKTYTHMVDVAGSPFVEKAWDKISLFLQYFLGKEKINMLDTKENRINIQIKEGLQFDSFYIFTNDEAKKFKDKPKECMNNITPKNTFKVEDYIDAALILQKNIFPDFNIKNPNIQIDEYEKWLSKQEIGTIIESKPPN